MTAPVSRRSTGRSDPFGNRLTLSSITIVPGHKRPERGQLRRAVSTLLSIHCISCTLFSKREVVDRNSPLFCKWGRLQTPMVPKLLGHIESTKEIHLQSLQPFLSNASRYCSILPSSEQSVELLIMAAPHQGPLPSSAASRSYTPAPERLRLRNSCHGCASSKLKCSQDKPTCSRCAKRGLTCEYLAAKQGGRKPNRQSVSSQSRCDRPADAAPEANAYACLPAQAESAASSSNSGVDALGLPDNIRHSPRTSFSTSSNVIQNLFGLLDEISSSASTTQIDFSDYFSTPVSYAVDMDDMDLLGTADIFSTGVNSSNNGSEGPFDAFPPFGATISELFTVSIPSPTPNPSVQPGMEVAQSYQGFGANKLLHSCLNRALRSMEQISSVSCLKGASASTMIRTIVVQNKATIESVNTMLTCACSQHGYLLIVISLVVFRVLDLYAAAARQTQSLQDLQSYSSHLSSVAEFAIPTPATVGNYCLEGADSARMAAQLVLSELHLVRRLVEQLSSTLKKQAAQSGRGGETGTPESMSLDVDNERALPLSSAIYDNLALDLAKRLKALSLDIINQLRKF
ncbi:uncharacterized protein BDR25DRAFT_396602 [Lindgomyces ingoldianus]|uniref:Uncharacterized protein n=1 Tax=Lindgomyces ingoldianus TaxID=673940 RepID=A0ACB6QCW5_9PLEO|nr:uncharacterized protein BDR25DRAFT_396602 [Lindgomyces ingoldianus]KAF2464732.1 hypothetical protein BDR25DRAFT_396602 [Lindgomyces ingoldianus]